MYAVIETGGKQYRVEFGTEIEVEHLEVDAGQSIDLDRILLVADGDQATIGSPLVDGALVRADVVRQDRGEKLIVFKYKPKARRRVKKGHRQELTVLRISEISLNGRSAAEDDAKVRSDERRARQQREEEASRQATADQALAAKLAADAEALAKAEAEATEPAKKGRSRAAKPAATTAQASDTTAPASEPAKAGEPATGDDTTGDDTTGDDTTGDDTTGDEVAADEGPAGSRAETPDATRKDE